MNDAGTRLLLVAAMLVVTIVAVPAEAAAASLFTMLAAGGVGAFGLLVAVIRRSGTPRGRMRSAG